MQQLGEQHPIFMFVYLFAVGSAIGSFLNVVIARLPKGLSIVRPASRCPRCLTPIRAYDNIPIISWLILRAKCRTCGLPISARYPMIELLTGALLIALWHRFGLTLATTGYFVFAASLVALAYIDLDTWLLPHQITWPLIALGLLSPLWNPRLSFAEAAIGGAAGFGALAAVALFGEKVLKRETMGWGDVWLLGAIGSWLGWKALWPVIMLSALQGSIVGIAMIAVGKDLSKRTQTQNETQTQKDQTQTETDTQSESESPSKPESTSESESKSESESDTWVPPPHAVPYGPFLALAALQDLLLGDLFATWYDALLSRLWS